MSLMEVGPDEIIESGTSSSCVDAGCAGDSSFFPHPTSRTRLASAAHDPANIRDMRVLPKTRILARALYAGPCVVQSRDTLQPPPFACEAVSRHSPARLLVETSMTIRSVALAL